MTSKLWKPTCLGPCRIGVIDPLPCLIFTWMLRIKLKPLVLPGVQTALSQTSHFISLAPDICRFFLISYSLYFILDALYIQERKHMDFSYLPLPCEIIILQDIVLCVLEGVPMFCSVFVCCSCCCKSTHNILQVYFRKKQDKYFKTYIAIK